MASPRNNSNAGFALAIQKFADKALSNIEMVRKKSAVALFNDIINKTPVSRPEFLDEDQLGIARGGWNTSLNTGDFSWGTQDTSGEETKSRMVAVVMRATPVDDIVFSNGVPYIRALEYGDVYPKAPELGSYNRVTGQYEILSTGGFSKQAPNGMVRTAIVAWPSYVDMEARLISR